MQPDDRHALTQTSQQQPDDEARAQRVTAEDVAHNTTGYEYTIHSFGCDCDDLPVEQEGAENE